VRGSMKARRLLYHSTLGLRIIKKKKIDEGIPHLEQFRVGEGPYMGTSLIRNTHPPRTTIGP